jgi:hypothetical protein
VAVELKRSVKLPVRLPDFGSLEVYICTLKPCDIPGLI